MDRNHPSAYAGVAQRESDVKNETSNQLKYFALTKYLIQIVLKSIKNVFYQQFNFRLINEEDRGSKPLIHLPGCSSEEEHVNGTSKTTFRRAIRLIGKITVLIILL